MLSTKRKLAIIPFALLAAVTMGCGPPPDDDGGSSSGSEETTAEPTEAELNDMAYLLALRDGSDIFDAADDDDLIELGHLACDALDAGNSLETMLASGAESWGPGSGEDIAYHLGVAIAAYCPEHKSLVE